MVTAFLFCHCAVCCMSVRAEVSGNRGGPPAADETADQRLLPLHRGHPCSSGSGRSAPSKNTGVTLVFARMSLVVHSA